MTRTDLPLRDILVAAILLTRLPLPAQPKEAFDNQARSVWAFPVVGFGLGCAAAVVFWLAGWFGLPAMASAGLALATLIITTGAMHEDGLADTADGLWGGFTKERRLEIMKDSRIGAYGVLALILGIGLRWSAMAAAGPVAIIAACTASRSAMGLMMAHMPNARDAGLSHSVGRPARAQANAALGIAALVCFVLFSVTGLLACVIAAGAVYLLARIALHKIGGQTGDILGASQQIAEIALLLAFAAAVA